MSQQAFDLASRVKDLLRDNWTLEDQLEKSKFTWYEFLPTRKEIREKPLSISVTFESGTGNPTCRAVSQMKDMLKIDVFLSLRNMEGDKVRRTSESNRMLIKDMILKIIHNKQTAIPDVKFGKYVRSARSDEVDSENTQWFLHESIFIQIEWYHVN